jgi:hypothetical protein
MNNSVLHEMFECEKRVALKIALRLQVLLTELQFDQGFLEAEPMLGLRLAINLCQQLVILNCLKLIVGINTKIQP